MVRLPIVKPITKTSKSIIYFLLLFRFRTKDKHQKKVKQLNHFEKLGKLLHSTTDQFLKKRLLKKPLRSLLCNYFSTSET